MSHGLVPVRRVLGIAGGVYLVWWFVVRALLPDAFNPLWSRLLVVGAFFAALGASYVSGVARRHLYAAFFACTCLLTAHYYYLVYRNGADAAWTVGAYIVVVAVGACFSTRRSLLVYSLFTLLLGTALSLVKRDLLGTIFLPGLVTMTFLSNVTLRNRVLLETEREKRLRAEVQRASAESGVALRDEFIDVASHELRTPLTSLQLDLDRLNRAFQRGAPAMDDATVQKALDRCQRQITNLGRLVGHLLDASRVAGNGITLDRHDVSVVEVVEEALASLANEIARSGSEVTLHGEKGVHANVDRPRLKQVFVNLLRNALTFGLGKPIHVTVVENESMLRIAVSDTGLGIDPADQERIFGRFERAVSSRNFGGMGLGLYIAAQIVRAHGGTVAVESKPSSGSNFIIELPKGGQ